MLVVEKVVTGSAVENQMDNHLRKKRKKRHSQDFPVKKIKLLNEVSECCHLDPKTGTRW